MNIYLDLDGPILDASERYYLVYRKVMEECKAEFLPRDEYWQLKTRKTPIDEILNQTSQKIDEAQYQKRRLQLIEDREFLKHDRVFPEVYRVLDNLKKGNRLVLVTLRGLLEDLKWELDHLKLTSYFDALLTKKGNDGSWKVKVGLIGDDLDSSKDRQKSVVIGDTEIDILAAKHLKITNIAISRGIRTREFLLELKPDFLVESLLEAEDIINTL